MVRASEEAVSRRSCGKSGAAITRRCNVAWVTHPVRVDEARVPLRLRPIDALGIPLAIVVVKLLADYGTDLTALVNVGACALVAPALTRIDFSERRLPNVLTVPLIVLGLLAAAVLLASGDLSSLAALPVGAVLLIMAIVGGMGMGDVKLGFALALAGANFGWMGAVLGFVGAIQIGGIVGLVVWIARKRTLAFGPWLLLGYALVIWILIDGG